jgi:acetyl esterase/lipase
MSAHAHATKSFSFWSHGAPGALGREQKDIPTLSVYLPQQTGAAVSAFVICPGGGYEKLSEHEGDHYARWLNEHGIAGFVLHYRLGPDGYRHPAMLQDAARAVRTVRVRAAEWNVDPERVGIMGSSAGGHLASTLLTHFNAGNPAAIDPAERESSRPDLGILCYPVVTMIEPHVHHDSKTNLLGPNPSAELCRELSNELQVTPHTPPCFIWHTNADHAVRVENSFQFAAALRSAGVKFELHIYERGLHGMGLGTRELNPSRRHPWTLDCVHWLKQRGFAK